MRERERELNMRNSQSVFGNCKEEVISDVIACQGSMRRDPYAFTYPLRWPYLSLSLLQHNFSLIKYFHYWPTRSTPWLFITQIHNLKPLNSYVCVLIKVLI